MRKIVIGGGASGLMAAYAAASHGHETLLLERNEKLGKKIYITGKGRCNLTNACSPDEFLQNVVHGEKFLRGAAYRFPAQDTVDFMHEHGLVTKVERGNRVFPASDHASDVTKTLERACLQAGVKIKLNTRVSEILTSNGGVCGVKTERETIPADAVIVATGGLSYPSTGSTGDGYKFAMRAGHTVTPCVPSLVGIEADGLAAAQGITLKNCVLTARQGQKILFSELGELLFTHYGISGPLVLTLSATLCRMPLDGVTLTIDFKPALERDVLDRRILKDFSERKGEQLKNVMRGLLPAGCIPIVLQRANVSAEKRPPEITATERARLVQTLKALPVTPKKLRGFEEAVVTSGGVSLHEVDPKTMQSKKVTGLYFCGEVLDVDALTGGFNLQIAFSTGYLAGIGADLSS